MNFVNEPSKMMEFERSGFLFGKNIINISQRTLFSERSLNLEGFRKARLNYEIKHSTIPALVNSTKLWTLATSKTDEHINILRQSLIQIYANTADIKDQGDINGLYHLGPMTMCTFHHLDMPEKALEFYHEFNNQFFDTNRTALILMDLLFEHERYNDLLDVYRIRLAQRQREPTYAHRICFNAACYKLNTPESLQYAINLQNECKSDMEQNRRIDFIAMLAFNQKRFDLALSLLGDNNYLPANNIKLLAMAELNDWNEVCNLLKQIETNGPIDKHYRVSKEVFQKLSQKLDLSKQILATNEWETCYSYLHKIQHSGVSVLHPQTMDQILCMPIKLKSQNNIQLKNSHSTKTRNRAWKEKRVIDLLFLHQEARKTRATNWHGQRNQMRKKKK